MVVGMVLDGFTKQYFGEPRPFMVNSEINVMTCEKGFGFPSGHAMASANFAIVTFYDIFHGISDFDICDKKVKFYSKMSYFTGVVLAMWWYLSIPYSRYVMGVHSIDQIVFGTTIGTWSGLMFHFLLRDHIL